MGERGVSLPPDGPGRVGHAPHGAGAVNPMNTHYQTALTWQHRKPLVSTSLKKRRQIGGACRMASNARIMRVALEHRYTPYNRDDNQYSQSVEDRIIASLGGVYGPCCSES